MTEIQINCAHDKIVPLEELVPNRHVLLASLFYFAAFFIKFSG